MSAATQQTSPWSAGFGNAAPTPAQSHEQNRVVRFLLAIPEGIAGAVLALVNAALAVAAGLGGILVTVVLLLLPVLVFAAIIQGLTDLMTW